MSHQHHEWLADLNLSVVKQYERDAEMAKEVARVQQVGHKIEAKWANVLTQWLPRGYEVATRKYILLERPVSGRTVTRETDLVVLHPAYPDSLREREEILAGGVAAAFSVKRTIGRSQIVEACESATELHRGMGVRGSTIREELVPPVIYGLLGDSHEWKSPGSDPLQNVIRPVSEYDLSLTTPREALDLICVADLDCWSRTRAGAVATFVAGDNGWSKAPGTITSVMSRPEGEGLAPLTTFITALWQKLALNDPTLKPIADGLRVTFDGSGMASGRSWSPTEVLSAATLGRIATGGLHGDDWLNIYG